MRMLPALSVALLEAVPVKTAVFPSADIAPFGVGKALSNEATAGEPAARADSDGTVPMKVSGSRSRAPSYDTKINVVSLGMGPPGGPPKSLCRSGARG